jgi:hypothetical protein
MLERVTLQDLFPSFRNCLMTFGHYDRSETIDNEIEDVSPVTRKYVGALLTFVTISRKNLWCYIFGHNEVSKEYDDAIFIRCTCCETSSYRSKPLSFPY